jgi:hypothetical protein
MHKAWPSELLIAVLLCTTAGCPAPSPLPVRIPGACPGPSDITCTGATCTGGNSAFTNIFPVNGLSANGSAECNKNGIKLLPGSLHGGGCAAGLTLDIDVSGKRLIGRPDGPGSPCEGPQLEGASFVVRSPWQELPLKISKVKSFDENEETYEGYQITDLDGENLCQYSAARSFLFQLGFPKEQSDDEAHIRPDGSQPEPYDDFVVAMRGPLYDANTSKPITIDDQKFFQLACVGDALAQTYFLRDALNLGGNKAQTSAVLRMITANYCGQRMTIRGMKLEFPKPQAVQPEALRVGAPDPDLEAEWRIDGNALCIGTPRLMTLRTDGKLFPPEQLPGSLQPNGCRSGNAGKCNEYDWIAALERQCGISSCPGPIVNGVPLPGVFLTSRVGASGKLRIEKQSPPEPKSASMP